MIILANIILAIQHLQPTILCHTFILVCQNNCPFAKYTNFYSLQYFPLHGIDRTHLEGNVGMSYIAQVFSGTFL